MSFLAPIQTSLFTSANIRSMESRSSLTTLSLSLIMHSAMTSQMKNFTTIQWSQFLTLCSTQEPLPFLPMGRQAQVRRIPCKGFRIWQFRIYSSEVLTIGRITNETLLWQSPCMRYMEVRSMTCLTTMNHWRFWKTRTKRYRYRAYLRISSLLRRESLSSSTKEIVWGQPTPQNLTIHRAGVMLCVK